VFADLVFSGGIPGSFTYAIPDSLRSSVFLYQRVIAPFGEETLQGVIVSFSDTTPLHKVRDILKIFDREPALTAEQVDLAKEISRIYFCTLADALALFFPPGKIQKVTEGALPPRDSAFAGKFRGEAEQGGGALPPRNEGSAGNFRGSELPPLTEEQEQAVHSMLQGNSEFDKFLLFGVTGSGKTRVYTEIIFHMLKKDAGVIFLLPEIALSYQFLQNLKPVFGSTMAILHSRLTPRQRSEEYSRILRGEARLVVGTRSAVFAPVQNLSVIILDEEHDSSYKENRMPYYHARSVAWMRLNKMGHFHGRILLLGSASPSLESYALARSGFYQMLRLNRRATGMNLPQTYLHTYNVPNSLLSPFLRNKMKEHLARGKQVLLLLNRRGYKNYAVCRECSTVAMCPHCSVSLTYHKNGELKCHLCGHTEMYTGICASCHSRQTLVGAGTQKIEDELDNFFPGIEYARLDQDSAREPDFTPELLKAMQSGKVNILFGTQMVAKGFDLPGVTLVGIIQADSALYFSDFRGAEKTFQLVLQASGRAGRHSEGEVVIQTENAPHYSVRYAASSDYESFAASELSLREEFQYPPYRRFLRILFRASQESDVIRAAEAVALFLRGGDDGLFSPAVPSEREREMELIGPAPAPLAKASSEYRWHLLLRSKRSEPLREAAARLMAAVESRELRLHSVKMFLDPDPVDLM